MLPQEIRAIFSPFVLNSDGFNVFFLIKSIIAKQFDGSRINRMCIFHVLTVRGFPGSEGASFRIVYVASGQHGSPPGYAPDLEPNTYVHACIGRNAFCALGG